MSGPEVVSRGWGRAKTTNCRVEDSFIDVVTYVVTYLLDQREICSDFIEEIALACLQKAVLNIFFFFVKRENLSLALEEVRQKYPWALIDIREQFV